MDQASIERLLGEAIDLHQSGDLIAAETAYRRVLSAQPGNADALHLLGLARLHRADHEGAISQIRRAIDIAPGVAQFHNSLGAALRGLGRNDDAIIAMRRAIELAPDYIEARGNLGDALAQDGRTKEAIAAFISALKYAPNNADIHGALGELYLGSQDIEQAGRHIRQAASIDPASAEAQFNLANILFQEGDPEASVTALKKAIANDPTYAPAFERLGALLRDLDRPTDAIEALQTALTISPDDARSWFTMGLAFDDLGRLEEASKALNRAIELNPNFVEAHQNLGTVLRAMGSYKEAVESYDRALAIDPQYETAISNRALALLAAGNFDDGWRHYMTRPSIMKFGNRLHRTPLRDDLSGQAVLVLRDQGLGDEIYFLRFVRELAARNASITYRGQSQVISIIERLTFLDTVLDEGNSEPPENIALWMSAGDLPHLLGYGTEQDCPASVALTPRLERVDQMKEQLAMFGAPPYLGVTWRAGIQKRNRLSKIAPTDALANTLRDTEGTLIALQRNPEAGEIDAFSATVGRPVHDLTALNEDLETMLALLDCLDDYICVSNTNVHLREGLGKASRVLVPFPADYRWMNSGDESPWFPGSRVYRETYEDGWSVALETLTADLNAAYPVA